ncbi:hypothetical protein [Consotaella aegiceratis]
MTMSAHSGNHPVVELHATIETTAIYANALGEEQRSIAKRMWS